MEDGVLIFDGDDTLWVVEPLYDEARELARSYVGSLGLDPDQWESQQRGIDVANVEIFGLAAGRFPTSCVQAYERLCAEAGLPADEAAKKEIWKRASTVFERRAPLVEGAEEVLATLRTSFRLALLTRGDEAIQRLRISQSGIESYFWQIRIVRDKDAAVFREMARSMSARLDASWSIGNSLPSDIYPALECGMGAVWVDAHVWEYERRDVAVVEGELLRADRLTEVPALLSKIAGDTI